MERGVEFGAMLFQIEVSARELAQGERFRGLFAPGFEMGARDVWVVKAAVGADGDGQRGFFGVDVVAVEMRIGAQGGQDGVADGGIVGKIGFAEELLIGGFGRRHVVAAELRGARSGDNQKARERQFAAAEFAREFEGDDGAEAVSEEGERLFEVGLDGGG